MSTIPSQTASALGIEQARWRIDPSRSRVLFRTPTFWGRKVVEGRFEHYHGTLDLRRQPAIELTIDARSLDTGNSLRDRHLRSEHFFDVENHPEVRFVADTTTLAGNRLAVQGELSAAGRSLPMDLDATVTRAGDDALELDVRTRADHGRLGMTHSPLGMIRTPSRLIVQARLVADTIDEPGTQT